MLRSSTWPLGSVGNPMTTKHCPDVELAAGVVIKGTFLLDPKDYAGRPHTDYIVVHCSATPPKMDIGAEEIREWHMEERAFMDIGYHAVIKRDGTIERGRPMWAVGAGASGHNRDSIHVCMVGGVDSKGAPEENFTKEQFASLKAFLEYSLRTYDHATVLGHRDFPKVHKACPSFDVKEWWAEVSK